MTNPAALAADWGQLWLPIWPYASDDLKAGIYRMARGDALERRYIEANPQALSNLLVVDIDHGDALARAMWDRHDWLPNAVVENPANGHAHAVWALETPVTRTEYAHRKPIAYAAAIVEGLRRSVDGDKGYSGLITKNPTHTAWEASWLTDHRYQLAELDQHLTDAGYMPPPSWKRTTRRNTTGLGRNCHLFETARLWAYREVRRHFGDAPALRDAIHRAAAEINAAEFTEPLPTSEVHATASSIWRWITTRSRMWKDGPVVYAATFTAIQAARSRKAAQARTDQATDRHTRIRQLRAEGKSYRAIATELECSIGTIHNALRDPREPLENQNYLTWVTEHPQPYSPELSDLVRGTPPGNRPGCPQRDERTCSGTTHPATRQTPSHGNGSGC